jgi:hypothetical protein
MTAPDAATPATRSVIFTASRHGVPASTPAGTHGVSHAAMSRSLLPARPVLPSSVATTDRPLYSGYPWVPLDISA